MRPQLAAVVVGVLLNLNMEAQPIEPDRQSRPAAKQSEQHGKPDHDNRYGRSVTTKLLVD
jgi:hypothetical protein